MGGNKGVESGLEKEEDEAIKTLRAVCDILAETDGLISVCVERSDSGHPDYVKKLIDGEILPNLKNAEVTILNLIKFDDVMVRRAKWLLTNVQRTQRPAEVRAEQAQVIGRLMHFESRLKIIAGQMNLASNLLRGLEIKVLAGDANQVKFDSKGKPLSPIFSGVRIASLNEVKSLVNTIAKDIIVMISSINGLLKFQKQIIDQQMAKK